MKGKCLLISSTIIIAMFFFILNVLGNNYKERELKLINHYEVEVIDRLMVDKHFFEGYKQAWEQDQAKKIPVAGNE